MKKVIFGVIIYFLIIVNVQAADYIDHYYMKVKVNNDGSMNVRELVVPFSDSTYNNGYEFDLFYKGDFQSFDGSINSLSNSDIYNATAIENIKVYEVLSDGSWDINDIGRKENEYIRVNTDYTGESGKYQLFEKYNGVTLRIYNPKSRDRAFYIEYKIKDVVVVHNDVAELFWPFVDIGYKAIYNGKIIIELPAQSTLLKVWGHGDYTSTIYPVDNKYVEININNHPAETVLDARVIFDTTLVQLANKKSSLNALDTILNEEKTKADVANELRDKLQKEEENRLKTYNAVKQTFNIVLPILIIGNIILIAYVYKKHDKEFKATFNNKYYRDFPSDLIPGAVEYLVDKKVTAKSLSAHILDLIRRKVLLIENGSEKAPILKKGSIVDLNDEDKYLVEWLVDEIGNGETVTLKEISKASTNGQKFIFKYSAWKSSIELKAVNHNFYVDKGLIKVAGILYCVFIAAISFYGINYNGVLGLIAIVIAVSTIAYISSFSKRTKEGNEEYNKWMGLKRFMLDFGRMQEKELPEVYLWEKYLVYATVFGIADKVEKQMKLKIKEYNYNNQQFDNMTFLMLNNLYLTRSINSTVVNAITSATSAQIASSVRSSGSGSGGGFSGGSSFGGGGGFGGGGRGF